MTRKPKHIAALAMMISLVFSTLQFGHISAANARESDQVLPSAPKAPSVKKKPAAKKAPAATKKKAPAARKKKAATPRKASTPRKAKTTAPRAKRAAPREASINGLPPEGEDRFAADQVIVRYRLSASQRAMDNLVRQLDLGRLDGRTVRLAGVTVHLYAITDGTPVRTVIAALQADGTVVSAQPNYIYRLQQDNTAKAPAKPNTAQYALDRLGIAKMHEKTRGAGVPIAVIDSGIDFSHPELAASSHKAFSVTDSTDGAPDAHGTTIAGILSAASTLTGVAPEASVLGIRAFEPPEAGKPATSSTWMIAKALDTAHGEGARVLNMSFAGPPDPLIAASVAGAAKRGMIAVAAAGNGGPDAAPLYPAAYPEVIAVTAVDRNDNAFDQANRGDYIALAAPGVDILAPVPNNGYDISSGTSMAAAHVSGLIALMLSRKADLSQADILEILSSAATDLGNPGTDPAYGRGMPTTEAFIDL